MKPKNGGFIWLLAGILRHPANRGRQTSAVLRFLGWQFWKRIVRRPISVQVSEHRRFLVMPDSPFSSQVVYARLPEWDEMNFVLRYLRSTDCFLDIGANVGFYTVLASTIVSNGRIVSIEASSENCHVVREQIRLNSLQNISIREVALADRDGTVLFAPESRETGTIARSSDEEHQTVEVPSLRLDTLITSLGLRSIDLAKMDVEGGEMMVLAGAPEVLRAGLILTWLFELSDSALRAHGSSAGELTQLFRDNGYTLHAWDEEQQTLRDVSRGLMPFNVIATLDAERAAARLGRRDSAS